MKILVIPTTDWIRHPVPNRLNFIFDRLAEKNEVHILNFLMEKFEGEVPRKTICKMHNATAINVKDPSLYYILNSFYHLFKIRQIIKNEKIDVVVSANILPAFLVNFVKGKIPVVFDYLDHYEESASSYYPSSFIGSVVEKGVKWIIRYNLKNADSVITVTEEFEAFLHSIGVKTVDVIPNGVDTSVFEVIPADIVKSRQPWEGAELGGKVHVHDLRAILPQDPGHVPDHAPPKAVDARQPFDRNARHGKKVAHVFWRRIEKAKDTLPTETAQLQGKLARKHLHPADPLRIDVKHGKDGTRQLASPLADWRLRLRRRHRKTVRGRLA